MGYYLGFDLGSNSIGWAVTDEAYKVLKKGKKSLWGVRLFNESQTAAARRNFRIATRRRKREKHRVKILQEVFQNAISEIDPSFYQRLKDSFFYPDDKSIEQSNTLFNDSNYSDQDFYKNYPTIYHLRQHLMTTHESLDVRLIYLACLHIMKKRGHFHLKQSKLDTSAQFDDAFSSLMMSLIENEFINVEQVNFELFSNELKAALLNKDINRSGRIRYLQSALIEVGKTKPWKALFQLLTGLKCKLSDLFDDEELNKIDKATITFSDDYDQTRGEIESDLEDRIELIDAAQSLYSWSVLQHLLAGHNTLSDSYVAIYEAHKKDLATLKFVVNEAIDLAVCTTKIKNRIFRLSVDKLDNYVAYSGHRSEKNERKRVVHQCTQDAFYKFLKNELDQIAKNILSKSEESPESDNSQLQNLLEDIRQIKERIEKAYFLPRIRSSENGVIPQQLNAMELSAILKNASRHHEFLDDKTIEKIESIFTFKIPYYIGPFDTRDRKFSWIVRRSNETITPQNFNEVVDEFATAEAFIKKMTNKCTYLLGEDVLPKQSLLYSEYMVRNALNILTIDGKRIEDQKTRDYLYETLFLNPSSSGKINKKRIVSALKTIGIVIKEEQLGGIDIEIPAKLKAYKDFNRILGNKLNNAEKDEIVLKITVLPDSRDMIMHWLDKRFGNRVNIEERKELTKLKYADWGKLSEKIIHGLRIHGADGRSLTVIEIMREKALNLMEILALTDMKCGKKLSEIIDEINANFSRDEKGLTYEALEEQRLSPSVRKMVWQTLRICNELIEIRKEAPKKVFIEVARGPEEQTDKKNSRKMQLLELYKNCKDDARDWSREIESTENDRLKSKKLYLYYLQKGRCMYSGEPIEIDELFGEQYDVDHIFPRSLTKDDSFKNLVLVKSVLNRSKSDQPISSDIRQKMTSFWVMLKNAGFLKQDKMDRLQKAEFTTEDIAGFINRQLVETRQVTKAVANILKGYLPESKIIYVKASHVSDFRYANGTHDDAFTKFYFPKSREINDFHHAKDAYLNIVVGNVYDTKFSSYLSQKRVLDDERRKYNLVRLFDFNVGKKDSPVWISGNAGTIAQVKKQMSHNDILVTYEVYTGKGGFYKQQLVPKGSGIGKSPIKTSDSRLTNIERYGSYNKVAGAYFTLISHQKGKKTIHTLVSVPTLLVAKNNISEHDLLDYFSNEGYASVKILIPIIKYNSILEIDGIRYRVLSKSGNAIRYAPDFQAGYSTEDERKIFRFIREANKSMPVDRNLSNEVFHNLITKLQASPFNQYKTFQSQAENVLQCVESFVNLCTNEQLKAVLSILELMKGKGQPVDLSQLSYFIGHRPVKLSPNSGAMQRTINDKPETTFRLVHRSITGIYECVQEICK